ncbi:MAG: DUF4011 domain-containing protein [Endomicrobium sp.]|jgi:superfamily I DNA and/or RNA helicase|nr:DUF4011 domain-containing protein [Endomicrobium sp.]
MELFLKQNDLQTIVNIGVSISGHFSLTICEYIPFFKSLKLNNSSQYDIKNARLKIESKPAFFSEFSTTLDLKRLSTTNVPITDLELNYDRKYLGRITTECNSEIKISISWNQGGDEHKEELQKFIVKLIPPWQWKGIHSLYVTSLTYYIEFETDKSLEKELQSKIVSLGNDFSKRVKDYNIDALNAVLKSIVDLVRSKNISLQRPNDNLTYSPQLLLTPKELLLRNHGNPIELGLLFASLMLKMNLDPLLIFAEQSVFVAAKRFPQTFIPYGWQDDTNGEEVKIDPDKLIILDVDYLAKSKELYKIDVFYLSEIKYNSSQLLGILDVKKTIEERIIRQKNQFSNIVRRPISYPPTEVTIKTKTPIPPKPMPPIQPIGPPEPIIFPDYPESTVPPGLLSRIDTWKARLLDLSNRNSLLNFKERKFNFEFITNNIEDILNKLSDGKSLQIISGKSLFTASDLKTRDKDAIITFLKDSTKKELQKNHIIADDFSKDLIKGLKQCIARSKLFMEESGGANNLYLCFGFLEWNNLEDNTNLISPLIMYPVRIQSSGGRSRYAISRNEVNDPHFNFSLLEKLRQDVRIGDFDKFLTELPLKKKVIDINQVFEELELVVKRFNWSIKRSVMLGLFSFTKYLMWKDLTELDKLDILQQNPAVNFLIRENPNKLPTQNIPLASELDTNLEPEKDFCPLPSDSSQLQAIVYSTSTNGESFVLIGPPGTGKSQTIANIIATNIAEGKKVLFVAEKAAALNVVHNRLQNLQLDSFCLELHSNKANKKDIINHIFNSCNFQATDFAVDDWIESSKELKSTKKYLNNYVSELHRLYPVGLSIFLAIGEFLQTLTFNNPEITLPFDENDYLTQDKKALKQLYNIVINLERRRKPILEALDTIIPYLGKLDWSFMFEKSLDNIISEIVEIGKKLTILDNEYSSVKGIDILSTTLKDYPLLIELFSLLVLSFNKNYDFSLSEELINVTRDIQNASTLLTNCLDILKYLEKYFASGGNIGRSSTSPHQDPASYVLSSINSFLQQYNHLTKYESLLTKYGKFNLSDLDEANLKNLDSLLGFNLKMVNTAWPITLTRNESIINDSKNALNFLTQFNNMKKELSGHYDIVKALKLDFLTLKKKWDRPYPRYSLIGYIQRFLVRRAMGKTSDNILNHREDLELLEKLNNIAQEIYKFISLNTSIPTIFKYIDTDINNLSLFHRYHTQLLDLLPKFSLEVVRISDCINNLNSSLDFAAQINVIKFKLDNCGAWGRSLIEASQSLLGQSNFKLSPEQFFYKHLNALKKSFAQLKDFSLTFFQTLGYAGNSKFFTVKKILQIISDFNSQKDIWHECFDYLTAKKEVEDQNLKLLATLISDGIIQYGTAENYLRHNYSKQFIAASIDHSTYLRKFVLDQFQDKLTEFKQQHEIHLSQAVPSINHRLRPHNFFSTLPNQQYKILVAQNQKKRGHFSIRKLFETIPDLILQSTPCLLMSPLSIAQYLPCNIDSFDLVIFDEASQIPVSDAVGAMARGKKVIVVGDPKQLPPTNFFQSLDKSDIEEYTVENKYIPEESVLDECLTLGIPSIKLLWHYRSRNEKLISFSNTKYYDDDLVTFPSNNTNDAAVSFHKVNGVYDRGRTKTNRIEAEAVVEDIIRTLKSDICQKEHMSIGVVTFNNPQMGLIDELLDDARSKDPSLDMFFEDTFHEPLLVKNLENIQGDERDIIYFSICFGFDSNGSFSMNFGPLGQKGGERRLNVAITRAKRELRLYSSFEPENISPKSGGVGDLRDFMLYAQNRYNTQNQSFIEGQPDSAFAQHIKQVLTERGWTVHSDIGRSHFRIDLAVVHPNDPSTYLAGIECDGHNYRKAATATDRNILREKVLGSLGWVILRVWSPAWFRSPAKEAESLHNQLTALLKNDLKIRLV